MGRKLRDQRDGTDTDDDHTRFNEAFNQHDVEVVMPLMTDDIVFENTSGGRFEGEVAVRGVLTRAFELMSTGRFDTEDMFAAGDRCVVQWTYTFNTEEPERGHVRGVDILAVCATIWSQRSSRT